jgi:hypothetical protein
VRQRPLRVLLLYAASPDSTLSYQVGWPRHFMLHSRFACTPVNLAAGRLERLSAAPRIVARRFDACILLHSVFSNAPFLEGFLLRLVERLRAPVAYFVSNDYKLVPEKLALCRKLGVRLFVSLTASPPVLDAYQRALGCAVISLPVPGAGLDTDVFFPTAPRATRPLHLGFRAAEEPLYFGHQERRAMVERFQTEARRRDLRVDLSLDDAARLTREDYATFLNRCQGQLGTEGGSDYFDVDDGPRNAVNAYLREHPGAGVEEVTRVCLAAWTPCPARALTGRHVEAAGTRTVQILYEGEYNGYFKPDVHYIPVRKDLADIDDALAKLADVGYSDRIAENAYELAHADLTYAVLIDRFADAFTATL